MQLSYKYQAYPNKEVETTLFYHLDLCRWTYNTLLGILNDHRGEYGKEDTQAAITRIKEYYPFLKDVYSKTLQMVNNRLWGSIKGLSKLKKKGRKVGRLKYKQFGQYNTLEYNQYGFFVDTKRQIASFSKIGEMPFDMHRPLPKNGKVKGITISRQYGKWYLIMQIQIPDVDNRLAEMVGAGEPVPEKMLNGKKIVGIDVGVTSFVKEFDGEEYHEVENPKLLSSKMEELRFRQRSLSRKQKSSNKWKKAKKKIGRVHRKIKNIRNDRNHQVSRKYVDSYDVIVVEALDITGMVNRQHKVKKLSPKARRTLRRNILDAGWGDFTQKLDYKAEMADKLLLKISPRNTTQRCSHCGSLVYKDITKRIHKCPYCGFEIDRDSNAAVNIRSDGIAFMRAGNRSEPEKDRTEPVEEGASTVSKDGKYPLVKQEAHVL